MYHLTDNIQVHERADWRARQPIAVTSQPTPHEAFIHHGAESDKEARAITNQSETLAAMRGIQNFHMDDNKWNDIGYHYVVFQPHGDLRFAHICEGRMVRHLPAAQLGHNTGTVAICIYGTIDGADPLHDNTVYAIAKLLNGTRGHKTGITSIETVGGHRDVTQTSCPGDMIYNALSRIARDAGIRRFK